MDGELRSKPIFATPSPHPQNVALDERALGGAKQSCEQETRPDHIKHAEIYISGTLGDECARAGRRGMCLGETNAGSLRREPAAL